ncbi:MAG: prepilin-type N-terminal cleavage/methylation domain-containing protein [Desulfosarcina sp.]|nr:prepilin-type N-terminal cleavage/methylation domain-containing protein [Desulfobacterales bacterium]
MPVRDPKRLPPQGFTLAEILIAIAIFALLVSIIMGSFSGVFSRTEALAVQRSNNAVARSSLMRMATDLGNAYVERPPFFTPPETLQDSSLYRFVAADALDGAAPWILLRFASRAHVDFSDEKKQGIAVIRYYLEPMEDSISSVFRLRRSDVLIYDGKLPEPRLDPILCENIRALKFECLNADGESSAEWDSSSADQNYATPRAVRIRLELAAPTGPAVYQTVVALPLWRSGAGKV